MYNRDILARLGPSPSGVERGEGVEKEGEDFEVVFQRPGVVTCRRVDLPALAADEVEVEAICSLISSGTELKVFRGDVDPGAAVDVNIEEMKDEKFEYPMTYGYSLVGRVVRCGLDVESKTVRNSSSRGVIWMFQP